MTHMIYCAPSTARKLPANVPGALPRALVYTLVFLAGFAAAWNAEAIRSAFQFEAPTIHGEDWHGNVRLSTYGD